MPNQIVTLAKLSLDAYKNTVLPVDGLKAVSATEFGIAVSQSGTNVKWTFDAGAYRATLPDKYAKSFKDDAVAHVYLSEDSKTLAVAFRGTDGLALDRVLGWGPQMKKGYYALYEPLIDAVKVYAASHAIEKILITGHSLGAAMAQYSMGDLPNTATTKVSAAIFGNPGAVNAGNSAEDRMIEFEYSDDAFVKLEKSPFVDFDHQGQRIRMPLDSASTSRDDKVGRYEHDIGRYLKAVENFANLDNQVPTFMTATTYDGNTTTRAYAGGAGNNSLSGEGGKNDTLYGGAGNDILHGRSGNDSLHGGTGNDRLFGDEGRDKLTGNEGADQFRFDQKLIKANVDTIADFDTSQDSIRLSKLYFKGAGTGQLDPDHFIIGTAANDANDRVIYNNNTGRLLFDADGSGNGAAKTFASVGLGTVINAEDFWIY